MERRGEGGDLITSWKVICDAFGLGDLGELSAGGTVSILEGVCGGEVDLQECT